MTKIIHILVILALFFCPVSPAQAETATPSSRSYDANSLKELDGNDGTLSNDPNPNRYDPNNPSYFNSLRWLVYALILFLPFTPPRTPSATSFPTVADTEAPGNLHE
jgi:hypothetical protein